MGMIKTTSFILRIIMVEANLNRDFSNIKAIVIASIFLIVQQPNQMITSILK